MSKVVVMDHPLIQHKIGFIRRRTTGTSKRSLGKYIWRDGRRQKRVCDGDSGSVSEYCRG